MSLADLDPRRVLLLHGTEVVLRVDRALGERTVPQGTVGRVTWATADFTEVTVVGVGRLRCARADVLLPRRSRASPFMRREASWSVRRARPRPRDGGGLAGVGSPTSRPTSIRARRSALLP
ncbi:MAG: hypothetical protein U0610_01515 [bacterium]